MSSSENLRDQQTLPAVIIRGQGNWGGALGLTHGKGTCDLRINSKLPESTGPPGKSWGAHFLAEQQPHPALANRPLQTTLVWRQLWGEDKSLWPNAHPGPSTDQAGEWHSSGADPAPIRMAKLPFSTLFENFKNKMGGSPSPLEKTVSSKQPHSVSHGATRKHTENSGHHFQERTWFGAEFRGRDKLNNTNLPWREGGGRRNTTGNVNIQSTG